MITEKDILRIATLSKLEIREDEIPFYKKELERMLSFVGNVHEDICGEMADVSECADFRSLREDKVKESFDREDITRNAPEESDGFIRLRKRA